MALKGIRITLDKAGGTWSWFGGEKGYTGFPYFIPDDWGLSFSQRVVQLVKEEENKFVEKIMSSRKQPEE